MTTNLTADRFGTPTNAKKYTLAVWFKLSKNNRNKILSYNYGNGNIGIVIEVRTNDQTLRVNEYIPGSDRYDVRTNRVFRDYGAWYHLVVAYDSTQSTASDRLKIYINGVQETSFAASSYPSQDLDSFISATPNNNKGFLIGALYNSSGNIDATNYFCGYMSQLIFVDGTAYTPSTFGSTNANGVWIPNTSPSVTYGTNGFKLEMKNSGASAAAGNFGADTSGNNNHFTSNNLGTNPNTKDSPTNVFATWNPNTAFRTTSFNGTAAGSIEGGGLKAVGGGGAVSIGFASTIAVNSGKWYAEFKAAATDYTQFGVGDVGTWTETYGIGGASKAQIYGANVIGWDRTIYYINSTSSTSGGTTFSDGDICQIAIDADTRKVWFGVNGTYNSSGNPAGGSNEIGTVTGTGPLVFLCRPESTNVLANFGNPPFTIASGNTDANGYGNFEYAVPSGFYALCTKNLGQYGG